MASHQLDNAVSLHHLNKQVTKMDIYLTNLSLTKNISLYLKH